MSRSHGFARALCCSLLVALPAAAATAQSVFINEFHYANTGTDTGEGVEIAGPAGTDLTGWNVVFYDGSGGTVYLTEPIGGLGPIPDDENGCGTVSFTLPDTSLMNGKEGIALVDDQGAVVQFLSYEGDFTATDGPASGMTSTDAGVMEPGTTPIGNSLQLGGTGNVYGDFTWEDDQPNTFGAPNANQTFDLCTPEVVATKSDALEKDVYGDTGVSPGDTLRYTVEIENLSGDKARNVQFNDTPDSLSDLVVGSVTTDKGNADIIQGNAPGDSVVEIDLQGINQGAVVTITFDVKVVDPLNDADVALGLSNQGVVSGNNFPDLLTDDPATGAPNDATETALVDICDGVLVTENCSVNGGPFGPCQGTAGNDEITGSTGNDVIRGGGGNDALIGWHGKDLLCGEGGDDQLFGMDGNDRIEGGSGEDIAVGGRGRDTISGGAGNDMLQGDDGRDRIEGGPGDGDMLDGGLGSDNCTDVDGAARVISCGKSCGLGFELALLLPGLLWLRGRRRS